MNIVTALCLIYMTIVVAYNLAVFFSGDRASKLRYFKSFKSAKVFILYLAAIPLNYVAYRYTGTPIGGSILNAISSTVESVVLKFNYEATAALMEANLFYRITVDICRVLIAVNAGVFVGAVAGQKIYNRLKVAVALLYHKRVYIIVGYNDANKDIVKSVKKRGNASVVMIVNKNDDAADFAFINKIGYVSVSGYGNISSVLNRMLKCVAGKKANVVINTLDDAANLVCADRISDIIVDKGLSKFSIDLGHGLSCYVFGGPRNEAQFVHFSQKTNGCIRYVNKYKLVANEFVGEYPLTRFMDERHIDYSTATLRQEADLRVVLVGFGETNRQMLLSSVANNQIPCYVKGELVTHAVKYFIYDRENAENNKSLNFGYYRYKEFYSAVVGTDEEKKYLPVPPLPSEEHYRNLDINDVRFYDSMRKDLSTPEGRIAYNYLIIAYGDDMENLDFADKIAQKVVEWGIAGCTKIFVKIRNSILSEQVIAKEYGKDGVMIPFGGEATTVYDMSVIETEKYEGMSRERHLCYALEGEIGKTGNSQLAPALAEQVKEAAVRKWYGWQQVQRNANIYACLNIRLKLNLLGYDYEKGEWDEAVAAQFFKDYTQGDPIAYAEGLRVPGNRAEKKVVDYGDCEFVTGSVRNTLAQQEHMRWNAYQISCGMIPASIDEMCVNEPSVLMKERKHRNITTYDGLIRFKEIMAKVNNTKEKQEDVIKYDYQIMDDLCWLLKDNGYKITKRDKECGEGGSASK